MASDILRESAELAVPKHWGMVGLTLSGPYRDGEEASLVITGDIEALKKVHEALMEAFPVEQPSLFEDREFFGQVRQARFEVKPEGAML